MREKCGSHNSLSCSSRTLCPQHGTPSSAWSEWQLSLFSLLLIAFLVLSRRHAKLSLSLCLSLTSSLELIERETEKTNIERQCSKRRETEKGKGRERWNEREMDLQKIFNFINIFNIKNIRYNEILLNINSIFNIGNKIIMLENIIS